MILVDSNIPMYLVGSPHPHKTDAQRLLEQLVNDRQRLVTDAEVLQAGSADRRGCGPRFFRSCYRHRGVFYRLIVVRVLSG